MLKITKSNFNEEVLQSNQTVLLDFYAEWCGPCKMISPIIDEIAEEEKEIKVGKINIDDNQEIAQKYDVMSIPTLIVIKQGKEVDRIVGYVEKEKILKIIK